VTGFVLLRVRAHRLLLCSALLAVILTTCVLAALAAFSSAVGEAGLRRALQDPSAVRTLVEARADVSGRDAARMDREVRKAAAGAYDGLPVRVVSSTRSGPYALPLALRPKGAARSADPDLTLLATFDRSRVTMTEGTRPGPARAGEPVPVALPENAARALGVHPGDLITLADRLRGGAPLRVRLTGIYRRADPGALYWRLDPLGGRGVETSAFTTYGPMLADPQVFGSGRVAAAAMYWQARADFSTMTTARIGRLSASVQSGVARIGRTSEGGAATATTGLPEVLAGLRGTLLVSRSTLLIGTLQLVLLAAYALLLVAGLLAQERSGETVLLRARGASRARVVGLAAAEALLLAVPAALAAPLLAGPLMRLMAGHGALARAGVRLDGPSGAAWWVALGTALACALAVAGPALRRPAASTTAATRRGPVPGAVQAGADLGLLVVAGLAYWQLSRRASGSGGGSGALSADTGGALGIDPVLVAAPALCLLAGTVLALRLLPVAARLGERLAARARGLPTALAGWQLSRRPGRGAGPALLLVLAVAMGVFAIGEGTSWARSQRDQADFAVGTDIRVDGSTTSPFGQGGMYDPMPGVAAVTPVARTEVSLAQDREATVLAMDTGDAAAVLRLRDDLADRPSAQLLQPLRRARGAAVGYVLPDGARQLQLTARLTARLDAAGSPKVTDALTATFEDSHGVPYSFPLGDLPADGAPHVLTADFTVALGLADGAAPAEPLRLTGVTAEYLVPRRTEHHRLVVSALRTVAADGGTRAVPVPGGSVWDATVDVDNSYFQESDDQGYSVPRTGKPASGPDTPLSLGYDTGREPVQTLNAQGADTATLTLRAHTSSDPVLPAVASDAFLAATGGRVGSSVKVALGDAELTVRITGSVRALPTTVAADDPQSDGGALLLDLAAVNRALRQLDQDALQPAEWWLATDPGAGPRVAAALRARSDIGSVLVRGEQRDELSADPLGAGPQSALPAAVVAGAVLAAVGFAVSAAGAVRERTGEFAVLRALGTSRRRLAKVIAAEQGLLVLVAIAVGLALGGLLTRLVVPLIVLTAGATRPDPAVLVELPSRPVLALLAAVAAVPLLVVAVTALRPGDPAQTLRLQGGE
jgi:hypothetical protein